MREILFRAKTIDNESMWVEGFYVHVPHGRFLCDEHMIQTIAEDGRIGQLYDVYESTVGQFAGRTDKNGKEIFEGDIVRFNGGTFVVEFSPCRMGFYFSGRFGRGCVPGFTMAHWEHVEIIGNIHDNPELLEG